MHPITDYLEIKETNLKAYKKLAEYHYIKNPVSFVRTVYAIQPRRCLGHHFPETIGVFIYSPPIATLKARNRAVNDPRLHKGTLSEKHKFVTDNFTYISRMIIDPRFQHLGLAKWIIEQTVPLQKYPYIETLTPIDFTNDIFIKLGFQLYHNEAPEPFRKFAAVLQQFGITGNQLTQPVEAQKRIDCLNTKDRKEFDFRLHRFLWTYRRHRHDKEPLARITYALSKFPYPQAYLLKRVKFESKAPIK